MAYWFTITIFCLGFREALFILEHQSSSFLPGSSFVTPLQLLTLMPRYFVLSAGARLQFYFSSRNPAVQAARNGFNCETLCKTMIETAGMRD
jgi:hypothetical protein